MHTYMGSTTPCGREQKVAESKHICVTDGILDCKKVEFLFLRISVKILSTSFLGICIKLQLTVARPFPWEAIMALREIVLP